MKKLHTLFILAIAIFIIIPRLGYAEEANVSVEVDAEASINQPNPSLIREKLRMANQIKEKERKTREMRALATTTRSMLKDVKEERKENMKKASTSMEKKEIRMNTHIDIFKAQQAKLVKHLETALNNLIQIRTRIISRIEKMKENDINTDEAIRLLALADIQISEARSAIAILANYKPEDSTGTDASASSSISIKLDKPRVVGENAIKAIKEAKQTLNDVIRAIAHAMGIGANASTTTNTNIEQ